jgi:rhodanese-related sulfurtransferase
VIRPVTRGLLVAALMLGSARAAQAAHGGVPTVAFTEPDYLKWLLDSRQPVVVVDLRSPGEFRRGHLPGAVSLPLAELPRRFGEIPTQPMVVLYCQCPAEESAGAYAFLEARGYANHVVLQEGHEGWTKRRFPLVRPPP